MVLEFRLDPYSRIFFLRIANTVCMNSRKCMMIWGLGVPKEWVGEGVALNAKMP